MDGRHHKLYFPGEEKESGHNVIYIKLARVFEFLISSPVRVDILSLFYSIIFMPGAIEGEIIMFSSTLHSFSCQAEEFLACAIISFVPGDFFFLQNFVYSLSC